MQITLKNWRTTLTGVGALATVIAHLSTSVAQGTFDPNAFWVDVMAAWLAVGNIFAKDAAAK